MSAALTVQPPAILEEQPKTKKITKKALRKIQEDTYLEEVPKVLKAFFPALIQGCKDHNPAIMKMAAQIAGLLSKNESPLVSIGISQNNVNNGGSNPTSIDQLVRRLDSRDRDAGSPTVIDMPRQ